MLFGKTMEKVFEQYYRECLNCIKQANLDFVENEEFELLTLMYTLAANVTRAAYNPSTAQASLVRLGNFIPWLYDRFDIDLFGQRSVLYGQILNGKELRGDWMGLFFNAEEAKNYDFVKKYLCLFGDILYNPACADDYDNAPTVSHGASATVAFMGSIMNPLQSKLYDFAVKIVRAK